MARLIAVGLTRADAAKLSDGGPRRDVIELAQAADAEIVYARDSSRPKGLWGKLFGSHIRHAWHIAGRIGRGDHVFVDSEHIGLPVLLFSALRLRRPAIIVILAHLPSRRWKLPLFWAATRLRTTGAVVVHSQRQESKLRGWLGRRWTTTLVPYQVDEKFWQESRIPDPDDEPLFVAVGSEHRDYATLVEAVRGLPVRVAIAAGSHWARKSADADDLPPNVEYIEKTLSFAELRTLYSRATAVVVPVHDVENQSGITTILEGMSMSVPVVTTASRGQREAVRGPLVLSDGSVDRDATRGRGPQVFGGAWDSAEDNGLYVPPGNAAALRQAIQILLKDQPTRERLGKAGRRSIEQHFTVEQFASRLARRLRDVPSATASAATEEPAS